MREKTYRIGEAADMLHLKSYVLRFWETEFPQLAPLRTGKGQRLYTDHHIALLQRIRQLLHEQGMTIEGARRVLLSASQPDSLAPMAPASPASRVQAAEGQAVENVQATAKAYEMGAGLTTAPQAELPKHPADRPIDRAVVREMREELLALRQMLTADA